MENINFTEKSLAIGNNRDDFFRNDPAKLVIEAIDYRAKSQAMTIEQAIDSLSKEPNFGGQGEIGGVNVYHYPEGQYDSVKYVADGESTWMTLSDAVTQAFKQFPNEQPDWFSLDWVQVIHGFKDIEII